MLGHANIDANDPSPTSIFTFNRDTLILPLVSSRTGGSRNDGAFGHWRVRRRRKLCLPGLLGGGEVAFELRAARSSRCEESPDDEARRHCARGSASHPCNLTTRPGAGTAWPW